MIYSSFRIDVGVGEIAILTQKVGLDLTNGQEVAPDEKHKGVQKKVLGEGRNFYNPYAWSWKVVKQTDIMSGEIGVKVSLTGDDLGYGEYLAQVDADGEATTRGIMPDVLNRGRYPINPNEQHVDIIGIGFSEKSVKTNLHMKCVSLCSNTVMLDPVSEAAEVTLRQYANYREKQLLAVHDTEACFVSVLARLRTMARRAAWFGRFINLFAILFITWLAYDSGVRDDLTTFLSFAPTFLLMFFPQPTSVTAILQSVTRLETLADLWRAQTLHLAQYDAVQASLTCPSETAMAH